ncbi:hypothetical protein GCM10022384_66420 [Streptomyces marokkonensis]|uniref:Uncharacterized protein n=1 Tax=Streptomyces marokkonensis TaxID=324855 RepID=A0ABP7SJP1_9ACTN
MAAYWAAAALKERARAAWAAGRVGPEGTGVVIRPWWPGGSGAQPVLGKEGRSAGTSDSS